MKPYSSLSVLMEAVSPSMRGRGLKLFVLTSSRDALLSPSMRGRGLKQGGTDADY